MWDKLRRQKRDVKRPPTRSCGRDRLQHNIVRKYSLGLDLGLNAQVSVQATFPPVIRDFSTGNPQASPPRIRSKSACFPHDLHTFFAASCCEIFIRICGAFPKAISRLDHKKNGGNQADTRKLRKNGLPGCRVTGWPVFRVVHIACGTWNDSDSDSDTPLIRASRTFSPQPGEGSDDTLVRSALAPRSGERVAEGRVRGQTKSHTRLRTRSARPSSLDTCAATTGGSRST
jgi:hypothetical protein